MVDIVQHYICLVFRLARNICVYELKRVVLRRIHPKKLSFRVLPLFSVGFLGVFSSKLHLIIDNSLCRRDRTSLSDGGLRQGAAVTDSSDVLARLEERYSCSGSITHSTHHKRVNGHGNVGRGRPAFR